MKYVNLFWEATRIIWQIYVFKVCNFKVPSGNIRILKLGVRKFHFPRYKKFFKSSFFYFLSLESYILKYKKFLTVSLFCKIKNVFRFPFPEI